MPLPWIMVKDMGYQQRFDTRRSSPMSSGRDIGFHWKICLYSNMLPSENSPYPGLLNR